MDNKKQEQEHASTLQRIANQEKAEAAKMKCGGKVKGWGQARGARAAKIV